VTAALLVSVMERDAIAGETPARQTATDTLQTVEKSDVQMSRELTSILTDRFNYRTLMLWGQPPSQEEIDKLKTDVGAVFGLKPQDFLMTVLYPKDGLVSVMVFDRAQALHIHAVFEKPRLQDVANFRRAPKLMDLSDTQLNIVCRRALNLHDRMGTRRTLAHASVEENRVTVTMLDEQTKRPVGTVVCDGDEEHCTVDEEAMSQLLSASK
jgi:hypothetical protein